MLGEEISIDGPIHIIYMWTLVKYSWFSWQSSTRGDHWAIPLSKNKTNKNILPCNTTLNRKIEIDEEWVDCVAWPIRNTGLTKKRVGLGLPL